jgi:hypothetical protein
MITHTVTALKSQATPTGAILDRFCGPGWTATPGKMLELLRSGVHEFRLSETADLRIVADRGQDGSWTLAVVGANGKRVSPSSLPHWQVERPRLAPVKKRSWFQILLDPDAAN